MSLGVGEILIIGLVLLLLFGSSRFADLGRSLGAGLRDLKRGLNGKSGPDDAPLDPPGNDADSAADRDQKRS